jgi:glycerol-3-phosphate acyltransferase PlsY
MSLALALLVGFLCGSVPWALWCVRLAKGIDVRNVGSGNVGATNASRAFATRTGRLAAFLTIYLLDAAKGLLPTLWLPPIVGGTAPLRDAVLVGAACVLGHVFTPWLRFRGGKGVATATGVLLALDPAATAVALLVFFAVRHATGEVFFGSLGLGLALPVASILLHPELAFAERWPVTVLELVLAAFLFWTHRGNLRKHFGSRSAQRA